MADAFTVNPQLLIFTVTQREVRILTDRRFRRLRHDWVRAFRRYFHGVARRSGVPHCWPEPHHSLEYHPSRRTPVHRITASWKV